VGGTNHPKPAWFLVQQYGAIRVIPRKIGKNGQAKCPENDRARETMPPAFNRSETIVCMLIAFCIGNATLSIIYRMMG
jgi:hypothetical protein